MKKFLKITGIIIVFLLLVFLAGYIYVIRNAQYLMHEFVRLESNGKVELTTQRVLYSFRKQQFILFNPKIKSDQSGDPTTSYVISLKKITLSTGSLKSVFLKQKITIDSIDCDAPHIEVFKNRKIQSGKISLPDEISKIYNSIEETISKLQIRHFAIYTGKFSLIEKYDSIAPPIRISNIDLVINNFSETDDDTSDDSTNFTDRIQLQATDQDILFPDGVHGMSFSKFRLNTQTRQIEIDSCTIYGKKTTSFNGEFNVFADTLRLLNTDLTTLARSDLIKVDSALCLNPTIRFNIEVKKNTGEGLFPTKKRIKDSLEASFKKLFANLDMKYIGVENAEIDIRVKRGEGITTYTSSKSNFNLHELLIIDDPKTPIQIGRFEFAIRNYIGYSPDSSYAIRFDSILLLKNKVSLSNFSIGPTAGNHNQDWKEVKMRAFELENITWAELIYNNKILAERAILVRPEVEIRSPKNPSRQKMKKGSLYQALGGFKRNFGITQLVLDDASVIVEMGDGSLLQLNHFNTGIQANQLLGSGDAGDLINSINQFSFGTGSLTNGGRKFDLEAGIYNGTDQTLFLGKAVYTGKLDGNKISAEQILVSDIERIAYFRFRASVLSWQKADISMNHEQIDKGSKSESQPFIASWQETRGLNTRFSFIDPGLHVTTFLTSLHTGSVNLTDNDKPEIENIRVIGNQLRMINNRLNAQIGNYTIADNKPSLLENVSIVLPGYKENLRVEIPKLSLEPDINSLMNGKSQLDKLVLYQPKISLDSGTAMLSNEKKGLPVVSINRLEMIEPEIRRTGGIFNTDWVPGFQPKLFIIEKIVSQKDELSAEKFKLELRNFSLKNEQVKMTTDPQTINSISLSDIHFRTATGTRQADWSANIDSAYIPGLQLNVEEENGPGQDIRVSALSVRSVKIGTGRSINRYKLFGNNPGMKLSASTFDYNNGRGTFSTSGLEFDNSKEYAKTDRFSFRPDIGPDSFMRSQQYRKDYITTSTGKITFRGLKLDRYGSDSVLRVRRVEITDPDFAIFKDMHLPFREGIIKPLTTGMIRKIGTRLVVDSIRIHNALITYEELNDKTDMRGMVSFNHTEAMLVNFRNTEAKDRDSLLLVATSDFLDTAHLKLRFSESYTDTLHGFLMGLRVGPFGLPALNPVLEPLASASIDEGWLDTLNLRAIGREYVAWGKMQMYYSGLHVKFLNKKDLTKKTIVTRLLNFAANAIVLRKKNVRKTGTVYIERMREKSIFHYWMKIVLSGAMSNAGIRGTNKSERKNHKAVKKLYVPEIGDTEIR